MKRIGHSVNLWAVLRVLLCLGVLLCPPMDGVGQTPAPCTIETIAGGGIGYSGDGGPALDAEFHSIVDILFDDDGNLFIVDDGSHTVRMVDTSGVVTTVAGVGTPGFSGDGGPATSAELRYPRNLTLDSAGNLYILDGGNARIRKVDPNGAITTIAGNGMPGFSGDGGPAVEAQFRTIGRMTVGPDGALYLADTQNHRVRRITNDGMIRTVVGTGPTSGRSIYYPLFGGDGGPAEDAFVSGPTDIAFDGEGRMFIADALNFRIRRVDTDGVITTIAGTGYSDYKISQFIGQPAISSVVERVKRIFPRASGEILFTTGTWGVWAIDTEGLIQRNNQSGAGTVIDMPPPVRMFYGVGRVVRELFADGTYERFAGASSTGPWGDGEAATDASIWSADDVAADSLGNMYIPDDIINKIRIVAPDGTIDTFAGSPESTSGGDGGPAILANLFYPDLIEVGPAFDVYFGYHIGLRHIDPQGTIATWPSTYNPCRSTTGCPGDGQPVAQGWLREPDDVGLDSAGNLYVLLEMRAVNGADYQWIRIVSPDGILDSLRLSDGLLWNRCTQCNASKAFAMAIDQNDNVLVALPDRIIRLAPGGTVEDVPGTVGSFMGPITSMTVDDAGNIYVVNGDGPGPLKRITPDGVVNTLASIGFSELGDGEGGPLRSAGLSIGRLAMDHDGNLLLTSSTRVRKVHSVQDCEVDVEISDTYVRPIAVFGETPEDEEFVITSTDGPLSYSLGLTEDWLSVSQPVSEPSGMEDTITVSYDVEGLSPGEYFTAIDIIPTNGSMTVPMPILLWIQPEPVQMEVSVTELDFAPVAGANPAPQSFTVHNPASGPLNYRIRPDQPWVMGSPDVGTSFRELDSIEIAVDAGGLGEGVHNATVAVEQVDGELLETIDVTLTVAPGSLTDLAATALTGPPAAQMGQTIDYAATIANEGFGTGTTFRTGIYLSEDETISSTDLLLDSCEFIGLANGAEMMCSGTAAMPGGLAEGFHYLGVVVDDQTAILESDEVDNARMADTGVVYISSGPCPAEIIVQNQTLTGTQMVQATTSATLGSNLIIDGESVTVNAPSVGILPGTTIGGAFNIGTTPVCP